MKNINKYDKLKKEFIKGWNTWNVRSMLSHVLMPYGIAVNIGLKEYREGGYLDEALTSRLSDREYVQRVDNSVEDLLPGAHSYDGRYTFITVKWKGIEIDVESACIDHEIYLRINTKANQKKQAAVVAEACLLWGKDGSINKSGNCIDIVCDQKKVSLKMLGTLADDKNIPSKSAYIAAVLFDYVYFYTGEDKNREEIDRIIQSNRQEYFDKLDKYGDLAKYYQTIQEVLAWNMIYEPQKDRVLTVTGRTWAVEWGGGVQHCWDMYFNGMMYSMEQKELAYMSIVEITREKTEEGFIPNCVAVNGFKTLDRSQPPVGSIALKEIYKKYNEDWIVELIFDDLLGWNTWYYENRQVKEGILGWGSKPYESRIDNYWESVGAGEFFGAALESGLDNSPMYDHIPMNKETNTLFLGDVGLTSLFIADAKALKELASVINRNDVIDILDSRIGKCSKGLSELWSAEHGIYLNYRTDKRCFDKQLSPTNFYSLLTDAIPRENAKEMIYKHLLNEDEFWGEWVLPSIAKDNPAFADQDYWRGRIWPPMNLLVYLGLKESEFDDIASQLADKSGNLIMKEWLVNKHIHENYCPISGEGCNKKNSEKFYCWGALLSYIVLLDRLD
ncbi:hypothetical protein SH1V18_26560 [Vallitalea longa]|uniref:Mannosylglycerate hydrolase MGH1-like glycoside hydrolase domain-containing protein n=1 Tax=Vallitalea longa TaxID=2936439 RepID=A0A9W5YCR3_9FIRM|nr:trehalase family glycosidase [Vallitalea longa]GKX30176.1 hypothetical protein SH1V18_26560 [Vallitalea longa]